MRTLSLSEQLEVSGGLEEVIVSDSKLSNLASVFGIVGGGSGPTMLTPDGGGLEEVVITAPREHSSLDWIGPVLAGGGLAGFTIGGGYGALLGSAEAAHLFGIGGRYAFSAGMIALCETPYAAAMLGATVGLGIASIIVIAGVTTYYVVSSNGN